MKKIEQIIEEANDGLVDYCNNYDRCHGYVKIDISDRKFAEIEWLDDDTLSVIVWDKMRETMCDNLCDWLLEKIDHDIMHPNAIEERCYEMWCKAEDERSEMLYDYYRSVI